MAYNGWTNYATWRVNLEALDGLSFEHATGGHFDGICEAISNGDPGAWHDTAKALEEHCTEIVEMVLESTKATTPTTPNGVKWRDLVSGFADLGLMAVNWREIARHMLHDYADEIAEALEREYDMTEEKAQATVAEFLESVTIPKT